MRALNKKLSKFMSSKKSTSARHWLESNPAVDDSEGGVACLKLQKYPSGIFYPASKVEDSYSARIRVLSASSLAATLLLASIWVRSFVLPGEMGSLREYAARFSFAGHNLETIRNSFFHGLERKQEEVISGQVAFISNIMDDHKINPDHAKRLARIIISESVGAGVDPLFTASVIKHESTFRAQAVSPMGAKGLMQLLPNTAYHIAQKAGYGSQSARSLFDPRMNIRLGLNYIKYLETMFGGNRRLALMAYNWGPANVLSALKRGGRPNSSVEKYAERILGTQKSWKDAYQSGLAKIASLGNSKSKKSA
jgi:hypothetical protein